MFIFGLFSSRSGRLFGARMARSIFSRFVRRGGSASKLELDVDLGLQQRAVPASALAPATALPQLADLTSTAAEEQDQQKQQMPPQPPPPSSLRQLQFTTRVEQAAIALTEAEVELASLSPEERAISTTINEVGELLRELKRLDEARTLFEEALTTRRQKLGDTHPSTLISLNNLGLLLREQGKLNAARPLLAEAVSVRRAAQGDKHPETLTSINNLGALLKAMGDIDAAAALYREALEARREVLGHSHPDTLTSINNLASLLQARGEQHNDIRDLTDAERLLAEGVGTSRRVLGQEHTHTRIFSANLAKVRRTQKTLRDLE